MASTLPGESSAHPADDAQALRDEIEQTRKHLGDTVEQLAAKADVKKQARAEAAESYDRNYYPWGVARQFSAVLGSGSLLHYDRRISAPTVVIHGRADKLMRPFGGRAVARAIDGARLVLIDGMGHDLPKQLWDRVIGELTTNFAVAC